MPVGEYETLSQMSCVSLNFSFEVGTSVGDVSRVTFTGSVGI